MQTKNEHLLDNDHIQDEDLFKVAVKWWERKRLIYTSSLILAIVIAFIAVDHNRFLNNMEEILLGSFFWLLIANICYTAGWGGELLVRFWFRTPAFPDAVRWLIFAGGTIFAGLLTFVVYYDIML